MTKRSGDSGVLIYGYCINDLPGESFNKDKKHPAAYLIWQQMIARCFSEKEKRRNPTYKNVTCCEDWKMFSKFKLWFDKNHIDGYHLDKDIIHPGNQCYSPEFCCFVPQELNKLLLDRRNNRGPYPIGVGASHTKKLRAKMNAYGKQVHLGYYDSAEEAFEAYKRAKSKHIENVSNTCRDVRIKNGLLKHAEIIRKFGSISNMHVKHA